ncbi:MAG: primosomal protein N' [Actinobacteria bacterium]|nr:MAG: primosomal protein N' [Actinomycetota bacterium]
MGDAGPNAGARGDAVSNAGARGGAGSNAEAMAGAGSQARGDEPGAYARVIVDVPSRSVDRPYDYSIPAELKGRVRPGSMVAVPFGPSRRVGYVVELASRSQVERVSAIDALLEEEPVFDEQLLSLCRWVSDYYLVPQGEALRLAVPPGRGRRIRLIYRAAPAASRAELNETREAVLSVLIRTGGASRASISAAVGVKALAELPSMVRDGLVEQRYETSAPTAREKTVEYARLEPAAGERAGELCRSPKQVQLVELLAEFGEMPVATLLAEAGASRASLRSLVAKGFAALEAREVMRRIDAGLAAPVPPPPKKLTPAQREALSAIYSSTGHPAFLLDGVTGSGKTEVYLRSVRRLLDEGKGAIILVPEISLTPQTVSRFIARLGETVAVMHSGLSAGERYDQWMAVRRGAKRVVVGARSAIFAPVPDLGIIVVDEEHETTYKQDSSPRYHAREVALKRGELCECPVVLGSATPSLESYRRVELGEAVHLRLPGRVRGLPMPRVEVVDMREEFAAGNMSIFSDRLQQAMGDALEAGKKAILLINRRGFSSFLLCRDCGYVPKCANCAVSLVYHDRGRQLRCHHCDATQNALDVCPSCGSVYLRHFGLGTQRVEDEVREAHLDVPVIRMDADTTKTKGSHARKLGEFARSASAVLLGTQMVAKGHDFPEVTVVGVVAAETGLGLPDFRAAERTFQLLVQVAGRAGRGDRPGEVIIQTYWPDHYAIKAVAGGEYEEFYEQEMTLRRLLDYPPFVPLVNIGFSGAGLAAVRAAAKAARGLVDDFPEGLVGVLGPAPAPIERLGGKYRYHMALKLHDRNRAKQALRQALPRLEAHRRKGVNITVDVDPVWMT